MPVEFRITDPAQLSPEELQRVITYLESCLGKSDLSEFEEAASTQMKQEFVAPLPPFDATIERTAPPAFAPPPPVPLVPAAPAAPSAPPVLDAQGIPWDGRIHASTKTFTANGNWKNRRGIDEAQVVAITAELRAAMGAPAASAAPAAVIPPPPPPPAASLPADPFAAFMAKAAAAINKSTLTRDALVAAINKYGLPTLPALMARPDLIPAVELELGL